MRGVTVIKSITCVSTTATKKDLPAMRTRDGQQHVYRLVLPASGEMRVERW